MSTTTIEECRSLTSAIPHDAGAHSETLGPDSSDPTLAKEKSPNSHVSHVSLEAAAAHLLTAGVGWIAVKVFRLFKRQQRSLEDASGAPQQARD
jgi:hypothetical protein